MPCMEPKSSGENKWPLRCLGRKQSGLMLGHQCIDDLVERFALDDLRQFVEREVDAVIAHAPLRKIVGADAFGTIARADLAAALLRASGIDLLLLVVVEPAAQ